MSVTDLGALRALLPAVRATIGRHVPRDWPLAQSVLRPLVEEPLPPLAVLPLAAAGAAGGDPSAAVPVAAAFLVVNAAIRLFDDLQDGDRPHGRWARLGAARASNLAAAELVVAADILSSAGWPAARKHTVQTLWNRSLVRLARGQDLDLTGEVRDVDAAWTCLREKNAPIYTLACACGAAAVTDDSLLIEACATFGEHLGVALQLLDDLQGMWAPDGRSDLAMGKRTLPLIYGLAQPGVGEELAMLLDGQGVADEAVVRHLLDQVGAREFVIWAALEEREAALMALAQCVDGVGKAGLGAYLDLFFAPMDVLRGARSQ